MGVENVVHMIVGRMCTVDEISDFKQRLKDMNLDEIDSTQLYDITTVDTETSLFNVFDADGKTKWPVVMFTFGARYSNFWGREDYEYHWYVVEKYIRFRTNSPVKHDFIPLKFCDLHVPHDPRSGILLIMDIE